MPTMEEIAKDYPWAVYDIKSLLGDDTPKDMTELSEHRNQLWRQYYVEWLLCNRNAGIPKDVLYRKLASLNEVTRQAKDPAPYRKTVKFFEDLGVLQPVGDHESFHFAIRRIKDAVKEAEAGGAKDAGAQLAGVVLSKKYDNLSGAETLITASLQIMSDDAKTALDASFVGITEQIEETAKKLVACYQDNHVKIDEFPAQRARDGLQQVYDGMRVRLGILHKTLETYRTVVVPYMKASGKDRKLLRQTAADGAKRIYDAVDEDRATPLLLQDLSDYGLSLLAFGTQIGIYCEAYVNWVQNKVIAQELQEGFTAEFPDAALGLIIAKTAVGVTSSVLGFFPPPINAAGTALSGTMMVVDKLTHAILVWQAKTDPARVLALYGTTYHENEEKSKLKELAEKAMEIGLPELSHIGIETGMLTSAQVAEKLIDLGKPLGEAMKGQIEAAEATKAIPGVGVVITAATLAYEWYEWNEGRKKEAEAITGLTPEGVKALQADLEKKWSQMRPTDQAYMARAVIGRDQGSYIEVTVDGIPGKWHKVSMRFESSDPTRRQIELLERVKKESAGKEYSYGDGDHVHHFSIVGPPQDIKWDGTDGSLQFETRLKWHKNAVYSGTVKVEAAVHDPGAEFPYVIRIANVELPGEDDARRSGRQTETAKVGKIVYQLDGENIFNVAEDDWRVTYELNGMSKKGDKAIFKGIYHRVGGWTEMKLVDADDEIIVDDDDDVGEIIDAEVGGAVEKELTQKVLHSGESARTKVSLRSKATATHV